MVSSGPPEGADAPPPGSQPSWPPYSSPPAYPQPPVEPTQGAPGSPPWQAPTPPGYVPSSGPPQSPGYGGGGYGYPNYGYAGYGYGGAARKTDGTAIAALILAIASFVICPVVTAIVALALIPGSRRNIAASGGALGGDGLLNAAKWIAWINIALGILGFAATIIIAPGLRG